MSAPTRTDDREFNPVYHSYGVHKAGLPPLVPYFRELWHRRGFAAEMSKATMRGANTTTFFGQAWLILNPLLLAGDLLPAGHDHPGPARPAVLRPPDAGLFAFTLVSTAITTGATSVTGSGKLLMNTAFPRLLIPLSAVRTAFFRFLPTIPVYLVFHADLPVTDVVAPADAAGAVLPGHAWWSSAWAWRRSSPPCRSTSATPRASCRIFVRIWMYLSPVLWTAGACSTDMPRRDPDDHPAQPDVLDARRLHRR